MARRAPVALLAAVGAAAGDCVCGSDYPFCWDSGTGNDRYCYKDEKSYDKSSTECPGTCTSSYITPTPPPPATPPPPPPCKGNLRVLFVGNSFTYGPRPGGKGGPGGRRGTYQPEQNNLPRMFKMVSESLGRCVTVAEDTIGACTLYTHRPSANPDGCAPCECHAGFRGGSSVCTLSERQTDPLQCSACGCSCRLAQNRARGLSASDKCTVGNRTVWTDDPDYHPCPQLAVREKWDLIVLQDHSALPTVPLARERMLNPAVAEYAAVARRTGAKVAVYSAHAYMTGISNPDYTVCPGGIAGGCFPYGTLTDLTPSCHKWQAGVKDFSCMTYSLARGYAQAALYGADILIPCGLAWQHARAEPEAGADCKKAVDAQYGAAEETGLPPFRASNVTRWAGDKGMELYRWLGWNHTSKYCSIEGCWVDEHPSALGMYLNALTFYATIFRESPVGAAWPYGQRIDGTALPGKYTLRGSIGPGSEDGVYRGPVTDEEAAILQRVAAEVVLPDIKHWNPGGDVPTAPPAPVTPAPPAPPPTPPPTPGPGCALLPCNGADHCCDPSQDPPSLCGDGTPCCGCGDNSCACPAPPAAPASAAAARGPAAPLRVLFVGDALTYGAAPAGQAAQNNVPRLFQLVAESLGASVTVGEDTIGSCTLYAHRPGANPDGLAPCGCGAGGGGTCTIAERAASPAKCSVSGCACAASSNARVAAADGCTVGNGSVPLSGDDHHACPQLLVRQEWDWVVLQDAAALPTVAAARARYLYPAVKEYSAHALLTGARVAVNIPHAGYAGAAAGCPPAAAPGAEGCWPAGDLARLVPPAECAAWQRSVAGFACETYAIARGHAEAALYGGDALVPSGLAWAAARGEGAPAAGCKAAADAGYAADAADAGWNVTADLATPPLPPLPLSGKTAGFGGDKGKQLYRAAGGGAVDAGPSVLGAYLDALVLYATLFKADPKGAAVPAGQTVGGAAVPGADAVRGDGAAGAVTADEAALLQAVAAETVLPYLEWWHPGAEPPTPAPTGAGGVPAFCAYKMERDCGAARSYDECYRCANDRHTSYDISAAGCHYPYHGRGADDPHAWCAAVHPAPPPAPPPARCVCGGDYPYCWDSGQGADRSCYKSETSNEKSSTECPGKCTDSYAPPPPAPAKCECQKDYPYCWKSGNGADHYCYKSESSYSKSSSECPGKCTDSYGS